MTIRMVIVLLITLYTTRAVLNSLGVEDFGIYNVVCGFVSMFVFLNTAMTNGIQRFYNYYIGNEDKEGITVVYNTAVRIQIIIAIILIILTETIGAWYLNNKMVIPESRIIAAHYIFQFSILSFVAVILQAPYSAAIMSHECLDYYAFVGVLDAVLKLVIALLIPIFDGDKLVWYGLLLLLVSLLNLLLYLSFAKTKFRCLKFSSKTNKHLFKEMLSFSGWNIFGSIAGIFKDQGINIVLNLFFGPIVNAARGVANQVNGGVQSFVTNISVSVRPQVIQSYAAGDIERTMKLTFSISKLSCGIMYLLGFPIILEIDYILRIWLGNTVPEHTASFIAIILITQIINNLNTAISGVVHASGKMALYQMNGSFFSILTIPVSYFLLKMGGSPESVLLICLLITAISHFFSLVIIKKIIPFSIRQYTYKVILPYIFTIIISFLFPYFVHLSMNEGLGRLVIVSLTSFVCIGLSFYFVCMNKNERALLYNLMKRIIVHK